MAGWRTGLGSVLGVTANDNIRSSVLASHLFSCAQHSRAMVEEERVGTRYAVTVDQMARLLS
jgi:hypothetical protein